MERRQGGQAERMSLSEPIRYSEVSNDWNGEAAGLAPSADGEWVKWEDYAAVLAVNERVCQRFAKTQCEANDAEAENARLKAEVERLRNLATKIDAYVDVLVLENGRLRKAGDAMADALSPFRVKPFPGPYLCDLQKGWEAAKECKQS